MSLLPAKVLLLIGLLTVQASGEPPLKYNWAELDGQRYQFKLVLHDSFREHTVAGTVLLRCRPADNGQANVSYEEWAVSDALVNTGNPFDFVIPETNWEPLVFFDRKHELSNQPAIVAADGTCPARQGHSLLFLAGTITDWIFEILPPQDAQEWSASRGDTLLVSWPNGRPNPRKFPCTVDSQYSLGAVTGNSVTTNKLFSVKSKDVCGGEPRIELSGTQAITFDKEHGWLDRSEFAGNFFIREEFVQFRWAVTMSVNRVIQ